MLCFPAQIKVGTLCVKVHQVLKLEHEIGADGNTKKPKKKYFYLKRNGIFFWNLKNIFAAI